MKALKDILRQWLPIAAATTAFCALAYLAVQQALRRAANVPQIQLLLSGEPLRTTPSVAVGLDSPVIS